MPFFHTCAQFRMERWDHPTVEEREGGGLVWSVRLGWLVRARVPISSSSTPRRRAAESAKKWPQQRQFQSGSTREETIVQGVCGVQKPISYTLNLFTDSKSRETAHARRKSLDFKKRDTEKETFWSTFFQTLS